jgi:O-antigen/teichoic acid export membrane protein
MAYWFQGWFINFSSGIFIREKTIRFPLITFFGALFTIGGNILLVPILGMTGSAIATLACYAAMSLLTLYYAKQVYPVKYPFISVILMMVVSSLIVWIGFALPFLIISALFTRVILFVFGLTVLAGIWFYTVPGSNK